MSSDKPFTQIDKRLEMPPLVVGNRTVRPVAHLMGWYAAAGEGSDSGSGAALRIAPREVVVREGENEYIVVIEDPLREPLRAIALGGVAVSALCLLIMLITSRIAKRSTNSQ